jgi:hypothetical protein
MESLPKVQPVTLLTSPVSTAPRFDQAGIIRLVYNSNYRVDENAMAFLKAAQIEICENNFNLNPA